MNKYLEYALLVLVVVITMVLIVKRNGIKCSLYKMVSKMDDFVESHNGKGVVSRIYSFILGHFPFISTLYPFEDFYNNIDKGLDIVEDKIIHSDALDKINDKLKLPNECTCNKHKDNPKNECLCKKKLLEQDKEEKE